mmetsp:Transcript_72172/g.222969  ORF Transcript_72172/g.222969 Transcript_72172/m.222969 type:complete len:335 (+) Transcript_72172:1339-2343(+)
MRVLPQVPQQRQHVEERPLSGRHGARHDQVPAAVRERPAGGREGRRAGRGAAGQAPEPGGRPVLVVPGARRDGRPLRGRPWVAQEATRAEAVPPQELLEAAERPPAGKGRELAVRLDGLVRREPEGERVLIPGAARLATDADTHHLVCAQEANPAVAVIAQLLAEGLTEGQRSNTPKYWRRLHDKVRLVSRAPLIRASPQQPHGDALGGHVFDDAAEVPLHNAPEQKGKGSAPSPQDAIPLRAARLRRPRVAHRKLAALSDSTGISPRSTVQRWGGQRRSPVSSSVTLLPCRPTLSLCRLWSVTASRDGTKNGRPPLAQVVRQARAQRGTLPPA